MLLSLKEKKGCLWSEVRQNLVENTQITIKPAAELKEGDFLMYKVDEEIIDKPELDRAFCTILGYYVSAGHCLFSNQVRFDFGLTEDESIREIRHFAQSHNIPFRIYERTKEHILAIQLEDKNLVSLLTKHGGLPNNKLFSQEVMKLPPEKQMFIIDAYLRGDRWFTKQKDTWNEQYFISTSREQLAYQLQTMLSRNKIFAPIHKREGRTFIISQL